MSGGSSRSHLGASKRKLMDFVEDTMNDLDVELEQEEQTGLLKVPPVKHPSWRVYRAVANAGLSLADFGLKDCSIYYPYEREDEYTTALTTILKTVNPETIKATKGQTDRQFEDVEDPLILVPCLELFLDLYSRQLIEGLILSNNQNSEITQKLHCSEEFIVKYRETFFDASIFKLESEKLNYIQNGTVPKDHATKMELLTNGAEYLAAKYGLVKQDINVRTVLAEAFARSYIQMVKLADIDDLEAQDRAIGWANTMAKFASELQKDKSTNMTIEDLVINLTAADAPTLAIGDLK